MLTTDDSTIGRIVIIEETASEYRPLFEIYYTDPVDAPSPLVAGHDAALAFASDLVRAYNRKRHLTIERKGPK